MTKTLTALGLSTFLFVFTVLAQAPLEPTDDYIDPGFGLEDDLFIDDLVEGEALDPINETVTMQEPVSTIENVILAPAQYTYGVVNVSQNNANAQSVGAREGDVLRYEFKIKSDQVDVVNFVTSLDISQILQNAEIIDAGLGNVNGGTITFPSFTQQAPCEKVFTFFVRLNKCTPDTQMVSSGNGQQTAVKLDCELARSGPGSMMLWYMTIALILGFIAIGIFNKRSHN